MCSRRLALSQPELRAPCDDVDLVADVGHECVAQVDLARHTVDQRDHVDENVDCSCVSLNRLFLTTLALASRLSVMIRFVLPPDDASFTSAMPSRLPLSTSSWMREAIAEQLVWYGISVTRISRRPFLASSMLAVARIFTAAATGAIGVDDAGAAEDARAGREVRALDELHEVVGRRLGVVDEVERRRR